MVAITTGAGPGFAPSLRTFDPGQVVPDALILSCSTPTVPLEGDRPVVEVPYVDADDDAGFVAEGDEIPEAAPDTRTVTISTGKVSVLGRVSREQYAQDNMSALLSTAFARAVVRKANQAFLVQAAPTAPAVTPPPGLLAQGVTDGGVIEGSLDAAVDAVAQIEAAHGQATHVLANPATWAEVAKLKTATGSNMSLVGAGTEAAARMLLSVPVLTSASVPADTLLVVDKSAVLSSYGQVQTAVSEHAYFDSDSFGIRVTWRFGATIVDPARVVKLAVAPAA